MRIQELIQLANHTEPQYIINGKKVTWAEAVAYSLKELSKVELEIQTTFSSRPSGDREEPK